MTADQKRPLLAFAAITLACALFLAFAMQTESFRDLRRSTLVQSVAPGALLDGEPAILEPAAPGLPPAPAGEAAPESATGSTDPESGGAVVLLAAAPLTPEPVTEPAAASAGRRAARPSSRPAKQPAQQPTQQPTEQPTVPAPDNTGTPGVGQGNGHKDPSLAGSETVTGDTEPKARKAVEPDKRAKPEKATKPERSEKGTKAERSEKGTKAAKREKAKRAKAARSKSKGHKGPKRR